MTKVSDAALDLLERVIARLPAAEQRDGQTEMVRHVAEAITTNSNLVIQAGTGTGKTLGYLVPILAAGQTAIIATYTKALQDQLASVDLPLLENVCRDIPDLAFSWAILKGRSNYICRQRCSEIDTGQDQLPLAETPKDVAKDVRKLVEWAATTTTGEISDVPFPVAESAWRKVSLGSDECPGAAKCQFGETCFTEAARERAGNANVIVVNFMLYGLDIANDREFLPHHDVVVFDEVHELEDVISDTASVTISARMLTNAAEAARGVVLTQKTTNALIRSAKELDEVLTRYVGTRLSEPYPTDMDDVLRASRLQLGLIADQLRADKTDSPELLRATTAVGQVIQDFDKAANRQGRVVAFVTDTRNAPRLTVAPTRVDGTMQAVWSETTAILTSATIPPGLPARLGLPIADDQIVRVASPFDYDKQSMLYLANDLPLPNAANRAEALQNRIRELIEMSDGSALVLFTSWSVLRETVVALDGTLPKHITIYSQDDMSKKALLDEFRADRKSCLFATRGFFQGVDVPGDALRLVIIDKVPFPAYKDPLLDARREEVGPSSFMLIDVPMAAAALAQAAGRLIRTATDHGVVAVLDPRLSQKGYKSAVLAGVAHMPETSRLQDVEDFFVKRSVV